MDGFLNVNKPPGMTSHDVVQRIRAWSGEKRVGHGGTLDPLATGVLPIALGYGTRLLEFVSGIKVYRADIEFGKATNTYDAEGVTIAEGDASDMSESQVRRELAAFQGEIEQKPPRFSAIKQHGKPLYEYARRGLEVAVAPRKVRIFRSTLLNWHSPVASVEVACSRGTYIRSLAHDIGQMVGCGAHLKALVRIQDGPFTLDSSTELDQLQVSLQGPAPSAGILPMEYVLSAWPWAVLDTMQEARVLQGLPVPAVQVMLQYDGEISTSPEDAQPAEAFFCRAMAASGQMRAVLRFASAVSAWEPAKVFPPRRS